MNDDLKLYLDGEIERSELPPDLAGDAERWDLFLSDVRESGVQGAPVGLESRVLDAIRTEGRRPWLGLVDWWVHPRSVRVRPWLGLAAAAVLATLLLLPREDVLSEPAGAATTFLGEEMHYVQFRLEAPGATSVHVAGDFNEWQPEIALADPYGTGVWSGRVRLPPGVHKYMFLVDGETWITDPDAERYVEDGYGNQNAVIAITGGAGARSLAP
ncbi:isoamylase early set domain-containing protein [Candidatus Palauibacter sp.]|uniref:isoamylase early set domain-containing protein n=1 Tax=Candidatus Palauibacter sp. TaxID=3101350 RepID=UPI003AF2F583